MELSFVNVIFRIFAADYLTRIFKR